MEDESIKWLKERKESAEMAIEHHRSQIAVLEKELKTVEEVIRKLEGQSGEAENPLRDEKNYQDKKTGPATDQSYRT